MGGSIDRPPSQPKQSKAKHSAAKSKEQIQSQSVPDRPFCMLSSFVPLLSSWAIDSVWASPTESEERRPPPAMRPSGFRSNAWASRKTKIQKRMGGLPCVRIPPPHMRTHAHIGSCCGVSALGCPRLWLLLLGCWVERSRVGRPFRCVGLTSSLIVAARPSPNRPNPWQPLQQPIPPPPPVAVFAAPPSSLVVCCVCFFFLVSGVLFVFNRSIDSYPHIDRSIGPVPQHTSKHTHTNTTRCAVSNRWAVRFFFLARTGMDHPFD